MIVRLGPDGRPIVDMHVTDSSGIGAIVKANQIRARAHTRVWRVIRDLDKLKLRIMRLRLRVNRDVRDDEVPEALPVVENEMLGITQRVDQLEAALDPMLTKRPDRKK